MKTVLQKLELGICFIFVAFQVYTATFGMIAGSGQKTIHLALIFAILYIGLFNKDNGKPFLQIFDILMFFTGVSASVYITVIATEYERRGGITYPIDVFFGVLLIVALIVATWRKVGPVLSIVVMFFIVYAFYGRYFPLLFQHAGFKFKRFVHLVVYTPEGILGTPLNSSATFICLFIILGSFFTQTGVGDYITSLATSVFGHLRGGPAKVAVVSSALFGSISGSATANVISTGTFTIPMMKKTGYDPAFAGAVEATSSTGGQIMPPIMGSAAFLIAEIIGVRYWDVVKAAVIPAVLYYVSILFMVDLYARRVGLRGLSFSEIPNVKKMLKQIYLLSPLVLLIFLIGPLKLTITRAGVITLFYTFTISLFSTKTRLNKENTIKFFYNAGRGSCSVAIACAVVGIIIGTVTGSGLSYRLSTVLVSIANGRLGILLLITMLASLVLGMGLPSTACYLVLGTLVAPAIVSLGVLPMAAHLFVFYYGIISNVTPPVALASYAAAGIAGCNPSSCGYKGFKLAIAGFILPFIFVNNTVLLGYGAFGESLYAFITALIGIYALACACEGYIISASVNIFERIILLVAALTAIRPGVYSDIIGIIVIVAIHILANLRQKKKLSFNQLNNDHV